MRPEIDFVESYDHETILHELQRLSKALGKKTLSRDDIDSNGRLSSGVIIKKFGSLRKAHQQAGLLPARFMKATDEELLSMLIELWTKTLETYGRSPYRTELRTFGFPVSSDTYVRRFGSWKKALIAAAESLSPAEIVIDPPAPKQASTTNPKGRKPLSIRKRFLVFKRDRYRCRMCGRSGIELEVDHIIPIEKGGGGLSGKPPNSLLRMQSR